MIVKEAVYEKCKECGCSGKLISDTIICCDNCKKEIKDNYLESTLFYNDDCKSEDLCFCSWRCWFKYMKNKKTNYFINMPYLHFDKKQKGIRAIDFWKEIDNIRNKKLETKNLFKNRQI